MKTSIIHERGNPADMKSLALAISFSLLLFQSISVISLNFWNSSESNNDAIAVNLAGKQRMLSQRIEKDLLKLTFTHPYPEESSRIHKNLLESYTLFTKTLAGLTTGELPDINDNKFKLPSSQSKSLNSLINQANALWTPMQAALKQLLQEKSQSSRDNLETALTVVMQNNNQLLQIMDLITSEIENSAHRKSAQLRMIEALAIVSMLVNFGFVMFYFRRQLSVLADSKLLSSKIMEHVGTAIIVIDSYGNIKLCNHSAARLFGYDKAELIGTNVKDLMEQPYALQIGKRSNGEHFALDIDLNEIQTSGRRLFIVSMYDLTEQKLREEQLSYLANHDPLTGLPNRLLFLDRLDQTIARAHRKKELAAILFIDLDRFKQVNDTLGHTIGDMLLKQVAARLRDCLREGDTLTRLGGDEFTMILDTNDINTCAIITKKILTALNQEFDLNGHKVHISGSIGASLYPVDSCDANTLLHYADVAMYHAKSSGGNTCSKYSELTEAFISKPFSPRTQPSLTI